MAKVRQSQVCLLVIVLFCIVSVAAAKPSSVRIAGLQMRVSHDIAGNQERILKGIKQAAEQEVDFLITPEGSLSGYHPNFDRETLNRALEQVVTAAREAGVGLALGTCYKSKVGQQEHCYNQIRLYSPEGDFLGSHSKILRCSRPDFPGSGEMSHYLEGQLRTFDWQGIRIGMLICNDLWATPGHTTIPNPYLPWKLKQMGAQTIFHAIHSGSAQHYRPFHETSVELWCRALRIPIVEVNAAVAEGKRVNAGSGVVDPKGKRVLDVCDEGEQFFVYDLKLPAPEPSPDS